MSDGVRRSYQVVGGPYDGEIIDGLKDSDVEATRKEWEAESFEPVDAPAEDQQPDPQAERQERARKPFNPDWAPSIEEVEAMQRPWSPREPSKGPALLSYKPPAPKDDTEPDVVSQASEPVNSLRQYGMTKPPPADRRTPETEPAYSPEGTALGENVLDALLAFSQGATINTADDLLDVLSPEAARTYREEMSLARERSPWLFPIVEGIAGYPAAAALGGLGKLKAIASNPLARRAVPTIANMGLGWAQGFMSDEGSLEDRLERAQRGMLAAGALHGTAESIGATAPLARAAANTARNAAIGEPQHFRSLKSDRGLQYSLEGVPEAAENLGIVNPIMPQSPRGYAEKARAIVNEEGPNIRSALAEAGQNPATHTRRDVLENALWVREQTARDGTVEGNALADSYAQMQQLLRQDHPPVLTPGALNELKTAYDRAGFQAGQRTDMPSSISAQTARGGRDAARELLMQSLGHTPQQKAIIERSMPRYGDASMIEDMAGDVAAGSQGVRATEGGLDTLVSPATRVLRGFGWDAAANVARPVAAGMEKLAPVAPELAAFAQAPAVRWAAGNAGGGGASSVSERVLSALQSNPELLGSYADELKQAANSPSPTMINDTITRLTMTEPGFRMYVLPMLQPSSG